MITGIINTGYEALSAGVFAAFFAQVIKFFIFTIKSKKINFKIFTTTGGMPSSHSAGVMGLATSVGLIEGWDSIVFAIAIGFALITMYDAAGVRRIEAATGMGVLELLDNAESVIGAVASEFKAAGQAEVVAKAQSVAKELKAQAREIESLQAQLANGKIKELFENTVTVKGIRYIHAVLKDTASDSLRTLGDQVKAGDLLAEFDMDLIKSEGYPVTTAVVITNTDDCEAIGEVKTGAVTKDTDVLTVL